jgi:D-beta-D-heptose 7-phosphate kinase/D-beta-D-heptose 1-phosphate adenosyltransferase
VLGDYIDDLDVWHETLRQSPEGSWPVVREVRRESRDGGAGAVAAMVEGLGATVHRLGDVKRRCRKQRLFVDGRQVMRIDDDDCNPISDSEAARIVASIPRGSLVLVADYGKGVVQPMLWRMLCGKARVIVDPSRHRPRSWYRGAWGYLPNRKEAGVPCVRSAIAACDSLRSIYEHVAIKLDAEGMVADGEYLPACCLPGEVVDVCGAGDMVLAAVGVAVSRGQSWIEACRFANEMAGLKCRQHGATAVESVRKFAGASNFDGSK